MSALVLSKFLWILVRLSSDKISDALEDDVLPCDTDCVSPDILTLLVILLVFIFGIFPCWTSSLNVCTSLFTLALILLLSLGKLFIPSNTLSSSCCISLVSVSSSSISWSIKSKSIVISSVNWSKSGKPDPADPGDWINPEFCNFNFNSSIIIFLSVAKVKSVWATNIPLTSNATPLLLLYFIPSSTISSSWISKMNPPYVFKLFFTAWS